MILGIDEVGRGPWAGPLVVGAVVLGGAEIDGLTDSKKLTKKRREELYDEIYARANGVGLGWVTATEIDAIGLSAALKLATKRAVQEIHTPFHEVIIDGTINFLASTPLEQYVTTMKKADLLIPSVSAASIVAKVARDRFMAEQDAVFPGYGFKSHVGYGTATHRAAIEKHGVTPLHRLSFAPLQKYASLPLPSSKNPVDSSPRSLDAGPVTSSAPKNFSGTLKQFLGAAPRSATRLESDETSLTTRAIGNASETAAAEELARRGHAIIARNWKTKYCEIDIVSRKDDTIYFTEVKHRKNARSGDGLAAITPKKLVQMKYAAKFYAHTQKFKNIDLRLVAVATAGDVAEVVSLIEID